MLIQSELNLQSVDACLLQMTLEVISPPNKSKYSSTYTVPVCSVAEGERTSQKPQIEDSLWEIQHPGIAAHKVILQEQGRGINTPGGSFTVLRAKHYRNCFRSGGKGKRKFKYACSTASTTGAREAQHSKHSSSYCEHWRRDLPCQKDAVFHTLVVQIWKANCSFANQTNAVKYVVKAKPWLCLVQYKGAQL